MDKYKFSVKFRLERRKDTNGVIDESNMPILADITFSGKRVWYYTGHRIAANQWIDKNVAGERVQQAKRNNFNKDGESATDINAKLRRITNAVETIFNRMRANDIVPTPKTLREELKKELDEDAPAAHKTLFAYFEQYIDEVSKLRHWSKGCKTKYNTILRHVKGFAKGNVYFEDVNKTFMADFVEYLNTKCDKRNSSVDKDIDFFKTFLNWATDEGYNKNLDYQRFKTSLPKSTGKENILALTIKQFEHLFQMEINVPHLERVRDVFCFCCATSLRYSDAKNFRWSNIKTNENGTEYIDITTQKTRDHLLIPLIKPAKEIINKYIAGKDVDEFVLPVISNQKYNAYLKDLGKLAGFDAPQTKVYFKGAERYEETQPFYQVMTSHVARKTFVTLGLAYGIPPHIISQCTGHHSDAMMQKYIRQFTLDEASNQMAKLDAAFTESKTIFDYNATDAEISALGISNPATYKQSVADNPKMAAEHVAILLKNRGDKVKMIEYMETLPQEIKDAAMMAVIISGM